MQVIIESEYIHDDPILAAIYRRAVDRFMDQAGYRVVFHDMAEFIRRQLSWKKQCVYTHALPILAEACRKVGEPFDEAIEHACPDAMTYRDVFFSIIES